MVVVAAVNYERLHGTLDTIEYVRIEKYQPTQKKQTWSNYFNCALLKITFRSTEIYIEQAFFVLVDI